MKSPFRSISLGGFVTAIGAYAFAHLSPEIVHSDLGAILIGVTGTIVGVLAHHQSGNATP